MASVRALSYRNRVVDDQCSRCKWEHICHGGCQARAYKFFGTTDRRDYYCPSLYRMYDHVEERLRDYLGAEFQPLGAREADPLAHADRHAHGETLISLL